MARSQKVCARMIIIFVTQRVHEQTPRSIYGVLKGQNNQNFIDFQIYRLSNTSLLHDLIRYKYYIILQFYYISLNYLFLEQFLQQFIPIKDGICTEVQTSDTIRKHMVCIVLLSHSRYKEINNYRNLPICKLGVFSDKVKNDCLI